MSIVTEEWNYCNLWLYFDYFKKDEDEASQLLDERDYEDFLLIHF